MGLIEAAVRSLFCALLFDSCWRVNALEAFILHGFWVFLWNYIADFVNGGFEGVRMVFEECSNSESSVFKCGAAYDE